MCVWKADRKIWSEWHTAPHGKQSTPTLQQSTPTTPPAMVDSDATASGSCVQSRPRAALGLLNFFSADIRDGFMPLLGAYLIASEDWTESMVGALATTMTVCGLLATTPAGDIMDKTKYKRLLIGGCTLVCTVCSAAVLVTHDFTYLLVAKALTGLSSAFLPPGITALCLGIVGPVGMAKQTTINEIANHLGNMFFAGSASLLAYLLYPDCKNLFWLVVVSGMLSVLAVVAIPNSAINDDTARNMETTNPTSECNALNSVTSELEQDANGSSPAHRSPVSYMQIFRDVNFMLLIISCMLFHLGNAVVLPLLGQMIAVEGDRKALAMSALCIVVAQITMSIVAWICGRLLGVVGFRSLLVIGFLSLPVRCAALVLLHRRNASASVMMSTQVLDGVGAGIFGIITPLFVQALSQGTGRFNMMFGVLLTFHGIGASISNIIGWYH